MKKLKLNLDELKIESFETSVQKPNNKGTIIGNTLETDDAPTCYNTYQYTCPETCAGAYTCDAKNTCQVTCGNCETYEGDTCSPGQCI